MKARRLLGAFLALAVVATAVSYWQFGRRDELDALRLYGNVDIRQVELGFRVAGRIAAMHFEEGATVEQGALLAELDATPLLHERDLAAAELERRRAALDKLESGSRAEEIAQARARVEQRSAALANARQVFERQQRLYDSGVVSQQSYDAALAARDEIEAQLQSARAALELALAGFRAEEVLAAAAELRAAGAQLALAETRLADTRLIAPAAGTLLTRAVEPGAIVAVGATAYVLSLDAPVWIRTYVGEPDLGRVRPGTPVEVHTDGGRVYAGRIGFVSPQAEFTPKSVQTEELRTDLVYRARIVVERPDDGLLRGMPVTIRLARQGGTADDGQR